MPHQNDRRRWGAPSLALTGFLLSAGAASATPFSITTTGTITSGSDTANLLGAGTSLVGDSYALTLDFSGLGASYYTDGSGQFALDAGDAIPGSITVTVAGHTTTTTLAANAGTTLTESLSNLVASNSGNAADNSFAFASQSITGAGNFVPYADLQTPFSYTLTAGDVGLDIYSLSNAANTATASFNGTTTSVQFATASVPEPSTWALLGAAITGVLGARRRLSA